MIELPNTLAECADRLYATRQTRLEWQKKTDALKEIESALEAHLINSLPKGEATGIAGKLARVSVITKDEPTVEDKELLHRYIVKNKAWDLLQGRLSAPAVRGRWDEGKAIPGIGRFTVVKLSVSKV